MFLASHKEGVGSTVMKSAGTGPAFQRNRAKICGAWSAEAEIEWLQPGEGGC